MLRVDAVFIPFKVIEAKYQAVNSIGKAASVYLAALIVHAKFGM
jgi:hypothetical protein